MAADGLVMEALARIEHKLDILLAALCPGATNFQMRSSAAVCPVCLATVDYQIDVVNNVVVRRCACASGKMPSVIPLLPIPEQKGAPSGPRAAPAPAADSE